MKKHVLIFAGFITFSLSAKAQDNFENLLLASQYDSEKLLRAYFNPLVEGVIFGMSNGWYHTAKVHKVFGFDINVVANATFAPLEKETFDISSLNLISVTSTGSPNLPTIVGADVETPLIISTSFQGQDATTNTSAPGGILGDLPLGSIPSLAVQFNVGLPWKLDVMLRFLPEIEISDAGNQVKMVGLGLKKEITKWFGPMEKIPLHVSVLAAATSLDINYIMGDSSSGNILTDNVTVSSELKSYTVQATASLNFPIINLFGGIGYSRGSSQLSTSGTITGVYDTGPTAPDDIITRTINPITISFDASGFTTTVGARLSLGFFKLFGSYTLQEYKILNAGVAFGFR